MSSLGPLGGLPAISAAARLVRSSSDVNQSQQNQSVEGQSNLRNLQATREIGQEGSEVGERDSDGRQAWRAPSESERLPGISSPEKSKPVRPVSEGRGQKLDMDL